MRITFFDTEINSDLIIKDLGAFYDPDMTYRGGSISDLLAFLKGSGYICGHNIIHYDLKPLKEKIDYICPDVQYIDTLYLSPLLFPRQPYHNLVKDDKLQKEELNNPLNDAKKAKELFYDEVDAFFRLPPILQHIFYSLLKDSSEFSGFFDLYKPNIVAPSPLPELIKEFFKNEICQGALLDRIVRDKPIALAYCLALINVRDQYSIAPRWLSYKFPQVMSVMHLLRSNPCVEGCGYCNRALDIHAGLKRFFGFDSFRLYADVPLQEQAVSAAIHHKSLLAIFPTGGGKSLTFQVPALMQGEANKGLTVVISPLQSLMKDQVDNLEKREIVSAVTINGMLDPIERSESFKRVAEGQAHLLYISPEALRSSSMERLLSGRTINRIVIDEAHCFSSWGHDFRVDYLYIGEFIKGLQQKKNLDSPIPVSCFTATAKPQVVEDIQKYFLDKLDLSLEIYRSDQPRTNLRYDVFEEQDENSKYNTLRNLLTDGAGSSIVYVSRTKKAVTIAEKLKADGYSALAFHGKLDSKTKKENQNAFIAGEVPIMVATSAFGMGVDKKDVRTVIHYEVSDSLENYVQESGRAGRDENLRAKCYILYNEDDLDKHFILQNSTRLTIREINQIWKSIKELSKKRASVSKSALDIARKAGWDETVSEIETRVTTAIAALEEAGYLIRKNNQSNVYASSIQCKIAQDGYDQIEQSNAFSGKEKEQAKRILKNLVSNKSRSRATEDEGEARIDYIADRLLIPVEDVIHVVTLLRQEGILANDKDLTAYIKVGERESKSFKLAAHFGIIINHILEISDEIPRNFHLKDINKALVSKGHSTINLVELRTALLFLGIKHWIRYRFVNNEKTIFRVQTIEPKEFLIRKVTMIHVLTPIVVKFLIEAGKKENSTDLEEVLVGFSIKDLTDELKKVNDLQANEATVSDIEDTLFYLSKIEAIDIEGGFFVLYKRLLLEINQERTSERFKDADYAKLEQYYNQKVQQVHIVGAYAKKMVQDYEGALGFVDDYFKLPYQSFIQKYFPGSNADELKRTITAKKFQQIFGVLSLQQHEIIMEQHKDIAVLAGPGSGKTRVLVHKLASVYLMENVKHEQILMLTFSRAAVTEFKKRLFALVGNAAIFIEIKTFHSFCFSLLGKSGELETSKDIIREALTGIEEKTILTTKLTRGVLLIDEAQDINEEEYSLIRKFLDHNDLLRVIMVGDDDQNIFEFRGSDKKYLSQFIRDKNAKVFELTLNYRSAKELVAFSNNFLDCIKHRLKRTPIESLPDTNGQVRIVQYKSQRLVLPVIEDVSKAELSGDTCVLTRTNEEAAQITWLLRSKGIHAQLIHSNEGFNLVDLYEVRWFLDQLKSDAVKISKEHWDKTKESFKKQFADEQWYPGIDRMLTDFAKINPKEKYLSDLLTFISESKSEDFIFGTSQCIWVSTFHKAKGKEFNNVYVMLDQFNDQSEEFKRTLYVAMTRAKQNLTIHCTGNRFEKFRTAETIVENDHAEYDEPNIISLQLSHKDVNLGHSYQVKPAILKLKSGDPLTVNEDGCKDNEGQFVIRFSDKFKNTVKNYGRKGYLLWKANVLYKIYWQGDEQKEVVIILPEVVFNKLKQS